MQTGNTWIYLSDCSTGQLEVYPSHLEYPGPLHGPLTPYLIRPEFANRQCREVKFVLLGRRRSYLKSLEVQSAAMVTGEA